MIYFSQQITQMKQIGKSLRSCLSAAPSACLAHADYIFMAHANLAKNAKTRSYDYGSHRSHESHEAYIAIARMYHPAANTRQSRQLRAFCDAAFVRFVRSA